MRAGLQREGAAEQDLRAQLEEVQAEEATLPTDIEAMQGVLQGELDALIALEASTWSTAHIHEPIPHVALPFCH